MPNRVMILLSMLATMAGPALAGSTADREEGDACGWPIFPPTGTESYTITSSEWTDDMDPPDGCDGPDSTGSDVFFCFSGCAEGTATWTADFEALVYVLPGLCDSACVGSATGREGSLHFFGGWPPEEAAYMSPIVVVDALPGQSGTITVRFDVGWHVPVISETWGRVKHRYEGPSVRYVQLGAPPSGPSAARPVRW